MTTVVFYSTYHDADLWRDALAKTHPKVHFLRLDDLEGELEDDCYLIALYHPYGTLKRLKNLKAILSIAAGVDHILDDPELPDVPIYRQTDISLQTTMREYAIMACLMLHRNLPIYQEQQRHAHWEMHLPLKIASQRTVGILGMGNLGQFIAEGLLSLGFQVHGWSRSQKDTLPFESHVGVSGLETILAQSEILLSVLPLTPETEGIMSQTMFAEMPRGAGIINIGRGGLLNEDDLISAIDSGQIGGAVLDVYSAEPLGKDSPLWQQPKIFMTPHIAGDILLETAIAHSYANLDLLLNGKQPKGLYSRKTGY